MQWIMTAKMAMIKGKESRYISVYTIQQKQRNQSI